MYNVAHIEEDWHEDLPLFCNKAEKRCKMNIL